MPEILAPDVRNYVDKKARIESIGIPISEEFSLPTIDEVPIYLLEIGAELARISGSWNPVEIYTADPESIARERQLLFEFFDRNEEYNPKLEYSYAQSLDMKKSRKDLLRQRKKLMKHKPETRQIRLLRTAIDYKIKDDLATCDLAEGIKNMDEEVIKRACSVKYPGLDATLLHLAEDGYKALTINGDPDDADKVGANAYVSQDEYEWLKKKTVSPEEQEAAFRWVLSQYQLLRTAENGTGFYVVSTEDVTGIDVRDKSANGPTIFLPKDRPKPMTADKLLLLLAHEVEGHARQSVNGEQLFFLGGGKLKIDNEQLYEGLGLRYELNLRRKLFGHEEVTPKPYYAFAVKMASEGASFYDIFKDQVERHLRVKLKTPPNTPLPSYKDLEPTVSTEAKRLAWQVTYRVMRGHADSSNPESYAMAKDLGYLRGFQIDKQLLENGLGFLNEAGIIASGALPILAEFKLNPNEIPIPFKDVATQYWEEVLKPQMKTV